MSEWSDLEGKLHQLVLHVEALQSENRRLEQLIVAQTGRTSDLEQQLQALKKQLDQEGTDRFKLKHYQEERKQLRKLDDQALNRLTKLEDRI